MPAATKLTKRLVQQAAPGDRDLILWDQEVRGFGCKVIPAGRRAYFLYYRTKDGAQRRPAIGQHGQLTVQEAREVARAWLREVAAGGDPSRTRQDARRAPTVADLCARFLEEHAARRNKPGTLFNYRCLVERFVLPELGRRKVADLARADVERLHAKLAATPYQANRVLGMLSKMLNLAERWGWRPDGTNPVRHVEKNKEARRERYLSQEEAARLGAALAAAERDGTEAPAVVAAVRLLVFTGCRLSEVLTLRWGQVDLERGCLRLPDSKTGAKTVYLNQATAAVLGGLPRDPSGWVLPGVKPGAHLVNLQKPWRRVRRAAGLGDLRIHDLRHSFASVAAGLGEGLHMIGKLLGHSQAQTSFRYAHLAADPVRAAGERVGGALAAMIGGDAGAGEATNRPGPPPAAAAPARPTEDTR
jgi:integrase